MATHDVGPDAENGLGDVRAPVDAPHGGSLGRLGPKQPDPEQPGSDDDRDRLGSWLLAAAAAVAVVLVVALLIRVLTWDWIAVGDFGTIRLRTLDVGGSHTPLVGVYSRWGWNHPGPMLFYLLAGPLRLTGGDGHGLLFGALLIDLAAIGATLVVAARAGRSLLALVALVTTTLLFGLGTAGLLDPWNPFVLIVPLFAAAVSAWRAALGDRVAAVVLVVAGSFAGQSHVGVAAAVAALFAVGAAGLVWRAVKGSERSADRRTLLMAAVVGLVCWLAPLVQQLTGSPGNLGEIARFALNGTESVNGWSAGAREVGQALSLPPIWVTGNIHTAGGRHPIPFALLALVVALGWAWRRRWTSETVLCLTALVLIGAAFVAASRITGVAYPYLFRWLWVVGAFAWMAVAAVVLAELRRHSWAAIATSVMAGLTTALLLVLLVQGSDVTALKSSAEPMDTFQSVIEPTMEVLRTAPEPTLVTITAYGIDGSMGIELLTRAEDEGLDLRYPDDVAYVFGSHRTMDPAEARSQLVLASGPAQQQYAADPRYRLVAAFDPLTPDERAEFEQLDAIDWNARPDGPSRPGPEYTRYRELSKGFESLSVFFSDQPLPTG
jgi:hypothetical protein